MSARHVMRGWLPITPKAQLKAGGGGGHGGPEGPGGQVHSSASTRRPPAEVGWGPGRAASPLLPPLWQLMFHFSFPSLPSPPPDLVWFCSLSYSPFWSWAGLLVLLRSLFCLLSFPSVTLDLPPTLGPLFQPCVPLSTPALAPSSPVSEDHSLQMLLWFLVFAVNFLLDLWRSFIF